MCEATRGRPRGREATRKARCAAELPSVAALAAPGFIDYAVRLARIEGLEGHARAAEKRLLKATDGDPPKAKKAKNN